MSNPELRRGSRETAWVEYLQGLLVSVLASEAAAGQVELSPVDGKFGPLTEGSVKFAQTRFGLPSTGVVDADTWNALENPAPAPSVSLGVAGLTLRYPVDLRLRWDSTTVEQMLQEFDTFNLATHPNARLRLGAPSSGGRVTPMAGNGTVQLFNREIPLWRNWFLNETTKFTLDWSRSHGFELGLDNEAEFGVRPLRNVELFLSGEVDLKWRPQEGTGSVDWGGMLNLRLRFDVEPKR